MPSTGLTYIELWLELENLSNRSVRFEKAVFVILPGGETFFQGTCSYETGNTLSAMAVLEIVEA
jgi:hypothetical protein